MQFKGVKLELLATICKREKGSEQSFFYQRHPSLLQMGVETGLLHKLPSLLVGNLFLTNTGIPLPSLPILPSRNGGEAPGVDLVASQNDVQFRTNNPLPYFFSSSDATQAATAQPSRMSPKLRPQDKHPSLACLCTGLRIFLTTVEPVNHKMMNIKPNMSLLSITKPVYVITKEVMKGQPARKK